MTRKGPTSEFAHLGYCAAAGISLGVGVTPLPGSLTFLPLIVSWSALVLASLVLFTRPGASARVNVQAFGLIAATMTISSFSALGAVRIAPIVFAASIIFISLAPHLALQVPDHQVLDLPLVMKRLPTIRQTVIAPPSRITQARVKKTVREANTRSLSMLASATVIAFVSGVIAAYQLPLNEEKPYAGPVPARDHRAAHERACQARPPDPLRAPCRGPRDVGDHLFCARVERVHPAFHGRGR